ncbi:MAG: AAA family ATPase [Luteibacter sp.]|uniref:ATP-dependent nuclease n=1 Tax=Luteibacter sp. TaxID=1886636 RepID=UPI0028066446|nr:AAA family ATPase [Luteibacter sp.]MDQ7994593.1 AAA family ATPase [Luteibacter sp.]
MAPRKKTSEEVSEEEKAVAPRARLHKLTIRNFRAIGKQAVEIELDDIVVLVGPNNTGKSSILRAYEVAMEHGELTFDDFPGGTPPVNGDGYPTIELETVLFKDSNPPADKWIDTKSNGDRHVRERWTWESAGKPKKTGYNVLLGEWDKKHGPWGAPSVAQVNRPEMHRIEAFDNPKDQADKIIKLLTQAISQRVKGLNSLGANGKYKRLMKAFDKLREVVLSDAGLAVDQVKKDLGKSIASVFPDFTVSLEAPPEDDYAKAFTFFKTPVLRMGPHNGYMSDLDRQGSGARRTLLWNALRILAEHKRTSKEGQKSERPNVLLLDEPELCLHPAAVRDACEVLYQLPEGKTWQVMVTTHSPAFIDLSRDNTSIIRVERDSSGAVSGTTIFRPSRARLTKEDKEWLKLLNMYDPYVAEFFFGGRTVIVEGDTEFTAFREVVSDMPKRFPHAHIVRARGKYTIIALCKILNQFGSPYAVLHDADTRTVKGKDGPLPNSAWPANKKILEEVQKAPAGSVRLAASLHTFEVAMFGKEVSGEKPYSAWRILKGDVNARERVACLLDYLVGSAPTCPAGVLAWSDEELLAAAVAHFEPL